MPAASPGAGLAAEVSKSCEHHEVKDPGVSHFDGPGYAVGEGKDLSPKHL